MLILLVKLCVISTDEDPSLRIESSAIINLRGVSTKLNKYIVFTMQTYKKLNAHSVVEWGSNMKLYVFAIKPKANTYHEHLIHFDDCVSI